MKGLIKFSKGMLAVGKVFLLLVLTICTYTVGTATAIINGFTSSGGSFAFSGFPCGECTGTNSILGFDLESRTYSLEEAKMLRALAYATATAIPFLTVMPNVKTRERLFREELEFTYQSKATGGRGKDECGPFRSGGDHVILSDKFIKTFYMYIETSICYKKLIGTWKQFMLKAGMGRSEENTSLNDWVVISAIRDANIQTDQLIWLGDYGSATDNLAHYDGFLKLLTLGSTATILAQAETHTFTGLLAGDSIEGFVGGTAIDEPFDTDNDTTVGNLRTTLAALTGTDGNAVLAITGATNVCIITSADSGVPLHVNLVVTDGNGLDACGDPLVAAGAGVDVISTIVPHDYKQDKPMEIDYAVITSANVLSICETIATKLSARNTGGERRDILDMTNYNIHVSSFFMTMLEIAIKNKKIDAGFDEGSNVMTLFGLKFVSQNHIPQNVIIGGNQANMFFGTDLLSDMNTTQIWTEINQQEVRFRLEVAQGVQIDRMGDMITNIGDSPPWNFQVAQPSGELDG